ncbi:hypothetical protein AB6825_09940 [Serratia proteamaculans]|uniref:hypothetical protein n=1 Tax=Serratia proteamaculans TaxID=28151 RepID=UPI0039BE0576
MIADILFGFLMLGSFFVLGVGFWALGQFLRAKGHGPVLDALDGRYKRLHGEVQRAMVPVGIKTFSNLWGLHRLPLFGSKYQRKHLEKIRESLLAEQQRLDHLKH